MAEEEKSEVREEEKTDGQETEPENADNPENMEGEEKATPIFNVYRILAIVLAIILVVLICVMVRNQVVRRSAQKTYSDLMEQVNQVDDEDGSDTDDGTGDASVSGTEDDADSDDGTEATETEDDEAMVEIPQKNLDWDSLAETNSDIYAWIYIPGTNVDYPILQHPTDDTHYLRYNMNGTRGYPGCIYTELATSKEFTDFNTVIYGHNMRNKTMFATLHNFEDESFFEENQYIFIYVGDNALVYQVFAAYPTDNSHVIASNDFSTEEGRQEYLDKLAELSEGNGNFRDVELTTQSHIVTLSTCIGNTSKRYLVQGVLIGIGSRE